MVRFSAITFAILLAFLLPQFSFSFDVSTLLTVVSLVFAILLGFFFAAATSNYLRLQSLVAQMNAGLISLFSLTRVVKTSEAEKVADAIDKYMMASLDYELLEHVSGTQSEFEDLAKAIDAVEPTDEKGFNVYSTLQDKKVELQATLQEFSLTSKRLIGKEHWSIIVILTGLVSLMLLSLRDGTFISHTITAVVLVAIYLTLDLLNSVDTNLFLAKRLAFESPQPVFRAIGRLPYFPSYAIQKKFVKKLPSKYRVGGEFSKEGSREIKVVSPS